jgi:hypothetical protein
MELSVESPDDLLHPHTAITPPSPSWKKQGCSLELQHAQPTIEGNLVDDKGELYKSWAVHWLATICAACLNWHWVADVTTNNGKAVAGIMAIYPLLSSAGGVKDVLWARCHAGTRAWHALRMQDINTTHITFFTGDCCTNRPCLHMATIQNMKLEVCRIEAEKTSNEA